MVMAHRDTHASLEHELWDIACLTIPPSAKQFDQERAELVRDLFKRWMLALCAFLEPEDIHG